MATITSAKSGPFSDTATWVGGALPGSTDDIVVAAGHTVTQDQNVTCLSLAITGVYSGTPGRWTVTSTPGTYILTTTAASGIKYAGTAEVRGQLYAGTEETPVAADVKFYIDMGSGSSIGSYLDINLFCTSTTNAYVLTTANAAIGATELSVDTDVTGDLWAVGDVIEVCGVAGAQSRQRTTIAEISASTITLTDALTAAKASGSYIILVSRNVRVTTPSSSTLFSSTAIIDCEVRQTSSTIQGTAFNGTAVIRGVISGFSYGVGTNSIVSGIVVGCDKVSTNPRVVLSGLFVGNASVCGNGSCYNLLSGRFLGNGTVCATSGHTLTGTFDGNAIVDGSSSNFGNRYIGAILKNSGTYDVRSRGNRGYGCLLGSSTQVFSYAGSGGSDSVLANDSMLVYDVADSSGTPQPGRIASWTEGGVIKSEDYASGTHGTPPVTLAFVHRMSFESATYHAWFEWPLTGIDDKEITVTLYVKSAQTGMTSRPRIAICDPAYPFESANEILASATAADNTDWQTLTVTYTPTYAKPLTVRLSGTNVSGTSFAFVDIAVEGEGGGYTYGDSDATKVLTTAAGAGTYHAPEASEVISTAVFGPSSGTSGTYPTTEATTAAVEAAATATLNTHKDEMIADNTDLQAAFGCDVGTAEGGGSTETWYAY